MNLFKNALSLLTRLAAVNLILIAPVCAQDIFQPEMPAELVAKVDGAKAKHLSGTDLQIAEIDLQDVLSQKPDYYRAALNLGLVYQSQGKLEEALQLLQRAKNLRQKHQISDASIFNSLGWVFLTLRRLDEAEAVFLEGLEQTPEQDSEARERLLNNLGYLYLQKGDSGKARSFLDVAIQKYNSTGSRRVLELVEVYEKQGQMEGRYDGDRKVINGIAFRWCSPGSFRMGSPEHERGHREDEAQRKVTLTSGFWIAETELTLAQFGTKSKTPNIPVTNVSHREARKWCEVQTKSAGLPSGWRMGLPTEAQWEYACRAATPTAYSFGGDPSALQEYAWFNANSGSKACEVRAKKPNGWGLYDMHGNVWEWCADAYEPNPQGATDPLVVSSGDSYVMRGGGWADNPAYCRSASRFRDRSEYKWSSIGFRPVVSREK